MQITHEEAHKLIQFKVDNSLSRTNEEKLSEHLTVCRECQRYFDGLKETESTLRQTMRKHWNVHPLPLQMDVVYRKVNSNLGIGIFLSTRKALIGITVAMFAFIAWQSVANNASMQIHPSTLPMIPTPATQLAATNTLQNECTEIHYLVQQGDSLESIAEQFSTSKESIIASNGLFENEIRPSDVLIIPFCESTPTSTIIPPSSTLTPIFEIITTTPG